jgi:predicted enzyme related to lactoylglutathione lyase
MSQPVPVDSQITFLYYDELEPVVTFYRDVLGLDQVADQGWAKIYRTGAAAYVGIVAGDKGYHQPREGSAVLITLAVNDVTSWYQHLQASGVTLLSDLEEKPDIKIRCFFFQDPGGYTFEVQQFLDPEMAEVFHPAG